jgi:hypothetical protein
MQVRRRWLLVALGASIVLNLAQCVTRPWEGGEGRRVKSPRGDYEAWASELSDVNPLTDHGRTTATFEVRRPDPEDRGVRDSRDWKPGEIQVEIRPARVDFYPDPG